MAKLQLIFNILIIIIKYSVSGPLSAQENYERRKSCGKNLLDQPTISLFPKEVKDTTDSYVGFAFLDVGKGLETGFSAATLISKRHVWTTSFVVLNNTWHWHSGGKLTEDNENGTGNYEIPHNIVKNIRFARNITSSVKVVRAFLVADDTNATIRIKRIRKFGEVGLPLVLELAEEFDIPFPCINDGSFRGQFGNNYVFYTMHFLNNTNTTVLTQNVASLQIIGTVFFVTSAVPATYGRGGVAVVRTANDIWRIVGTVGSDTWNDKFRGTLFFNISYYYEYICPSTGICPERNIFPPAPTKSPSTFSTFDSSTSTFTTLPENITNSSPSGSVPTKKYEKLPDNDDNWEDEIIDDDPDDLNEENSKSRLNSLIEDGDFTNGFRRIQLITEFLFMMFVLS